jgi:hypothetical protein
MKRKIIKKTVTRPRRSAVPKISDVRYSGVSKEEFFKETEKISILIIALKNEMNEHFERHENIILAEYRHRIETLETKVRELQTVTIK